jgi:hypothetical protein
MDVEIANLFKGIHSAANAAPDPDTASPAMTAGSMYRPRGVRALMAGQNYFVARLDTDDPIDH